MNEQSIEKRNLRQDGFLEVHSVFYTIQGEGPFQGTPCVFVRLAGCNLQCPGCDTDYTSNRTLLHPRDLVQLIEEHWEGLPSWQRLVVITGGEPFRQNLGPLFDRLIKCGFYVQVETNGSFEPPNEDAFFFGYNQDISMREGVYVVVSPKTPTIHKRYHEIACAFKYVMSYNSVDLKDGLPIMVLNNHTGRRVARPRTEYNGQIYLQPMDHAESEELTRDPEARSNRIIDANKKSLQAIKASCLKHSYILQLQLHKIIGVE